MVTTKGTICFEPIYRPKREFHFKSLGLCGNRSDAFWHELIDELRKLIRKPKGNVLSHGSGIPYWDPIWYRLFGLTKLAWPLAALFRWPPESFSMRETWCAEVRCFVHQSFDHLRCHGLRIALNKREDLVESVSVRVLGRWQCYIRILRTLFVLVNGSGHFAEAVKTSLMHLDDFLSKS